MPPILYHCPNTGPRVQGWTEVEESEWTENSYESVTWYFSIAGSTDSHHAAPARACMPPICANGHNLIDKGSESGSRPE